MTAPQNPVIVPFDLSHCPQVARLHCLHMKASVYGSLGEAFMTGCYMGMLQSGFGTGFVSLHENQVSGFAFGPSAPRVSLIRAVMKQWPSLFIATAVALIRHPTLAIDLAKHLLFGKSPKASHGTAELLAIVVDPDLRGNSDAVLLAHCLFNRFREDGCRRVVWETLPGNHRAQLFYKKIGGQVSQRVSANPEDAIWFEKPLDGCRHTWHARRIYAALSSDPCPAEFVTQYAQAAPPIWGTVEPRQQSLVNLAFEEGSDLEALEYACRIRGYELLPRLFTLALFLAEPHPEFYPSIINLQGRRLLGFAKLAYFSLRSVWKLLKGTVQLRRLSGCVQ